MSLVFITHHNENIRDYEVYDDFGITYIPEHHELKYVSKQKKRVKKHVYPPYITEGPNGLKLITDRGTHERRTMGCAHTSNCPKNFLRKNTGVKWRRMHDHVCPKPLGLAPVVRVADMEPIKPCEPKKTISKNIHIERKTAGEQKPSFPCTCVCPVVGHGYSKRSEKSPEQLTTILAPPNSKTFSESIQKKSLHNLSQPSAASKTQQDRRCKRTNFIALNRKRVIQSQPKRPPPKFVDTPNGHRQNLLNSGLIPQFVCSKNFTKVPCYIKAHKKLLGQYRQACPQDKKLMGSCEQYMRQYGYRRMTDDERVEILKGLRINHGYKLSTYQSLSFFTDTVAKIKRKTKIEKHLDQYESDIKFLEDNPIIYISDDPE